MRRVMNIVPDRQSRFLLALIPFVLIALIYALASAERRAANPNDKLLPPFAEMATSSLALASEPDQRTGNYLLWSDTAASLQRLLLGLGFSVAIGLSFGLALGIVPIARGLLAPAIGVISMIPPHGAPADAVHRLRPRRALQGRADRHRHRALPDPRPRHDGRLDARSSR